MEKKPKKGISSLLVLYCLTFPTRKIILLLWKHGSVPSPLQTWFQTALELCHEEPLAYYKGRMPDKLAEVWLGFMDFQFESYAIHNVIRSDWNVIPYFLLLKFNCFLIPLSSLHLTNTCVSLVRCNTQPGFVFIHHCSVDPFMFTQRKKERKKKIVQKANSFLRFSPKVFAEILPAANVLPEGG